MRNLEKGRKGRGRGNDEARKRGGEMQGQEKGDGEGNVEGRRGKR